MRNAWPTTLPLILTMVLVAIAPALAQAPGSQDGVYRLEFRITELRDGSTVNTRDYALRVTDGSEAQIRTGNRVPLQTGDGIQYLEVGLHIDAAIEARGDRIAVDAAVEINSFAAGGETEHAESPPVIRIITAKLSTDVPQKQPTLIGSIDDVMSGSKYEVRLTITELK